MANMQKDGVSFEELEEIAAKINFPLNTDADYLKLYKVAREQGWWPELDKPRINPRRPWVPPRPEQLSYHPNPFPDPDPSAGDARKRDKQKKQLMVAELERLQLAIAKLEQELEEKKQ